MAGSSDKSDSAFRTIGEAAEAIGVAQHVLRFWETRFPQLQPLKRGGGRRYYRPTDMALLESIRAMLHDEGLTIRGAQLALTQRQKLGRSASDSLPAHAAAQMASPSANLAVQASPDVQSVIEARSPISRAALLNIRDRLTRALAA